MGREREREEGDERERCGWMREGRMRERRGERRGREERERERE